MEEKDKLKKLMEIADKNGDEIEISLALTWGRGGDNSSLYAYYPLINGVACSGIPTINSLIHRGMILEELGWEK